MGISKKALDELTKSRETSVEALKPLKENILQIAASKDFDKLKAVSEETVLNATVSSVTYSTLQKLIDNKVLRNASSAKLRTFAGEINSCYSPHNPASLPDRTIRDLIAENWKEHSELFPLEGPVVTYGGSRVTRVNAAFSMVVENSKGIRKYLRYCNSRLPPNVGIVYSPIPVGLAQFQRCLFKHQFTPSHGRSNSSLVSCSYLWSTSDKELEYLLKLLSSELSYVLRNWSSMTSIRSFYHAHHCLGTAVETAKQRTLQSIFDGNFPGKQHHQDYTNAFVNRHVEFRTLVGGQAEVEKRKGSYTKLLAGVTADWMSYLLPAVMELWPNLSKQNRTAVDRQAIEDSDLVRSLEQPAKFLLVTLEYVNQRAYIDTNGVPRYAVTDDLYCNGFDTFDKVFSFVGVKLDQVITKSLLRPNAPTGEVDFLQRLRNEIRIPIASTVTGDNNLRASLTRGVVSSPLRIVGTISQISTIFDTLQRRNVWTTLLKNQRP